MGESKEVVVLDRRAEAVAELRKKNNFSQLSLCSHLVSGVPYTERSHIHTLVLFKCAGMHEPAVA